MNHHYDYGSAEENMLVNKIMEIHKAPNGISRFYCQRLVQIPTFIFIHENIYYELQKKLALRSFRLTY